MRELLIQQFISEKNLPLFKAGESTGETETGHTWYWGAEMCCKNIWVCPGAVESKFSHCLLASRAQEEQELKGWRNLSENSSPEDVCCQAFRSLYWSMENKLTSKNSSSRDSLGIGTVILGIKVTFLPWFHLGKGVLNLLRKVSSVAWPGSAVAEMLWQSPWIKK